MLAEQRLRALEATALLGHVMAEIDVAVFAFDGGSILKLVNRAGEDLLAKPRSGLLGQAADALGLAELLGSPQPLVVEQRLAPGGVIVQWLPMHLLSERQSLGILHTVQDVFPETTLWVFEDTGIVVARRDAPVRADLADLRRRIGAPGLRADLERLGLVDAEDFLDLHVVGPEAIRGLTARAPVVTDDRPWIEFEAFRHRLRPQHGRFRVEQARVLRVLFGARLLEPMALSGATPVESEAAAGRRGDSSFLMLGDLARSFGDAAGARALDAQAVGRATDARARVVALCHLAEVARQEGRLPDARRLVEESLRLSPGAAPALRLRSLLSER